MDQPITVTQIEDAINYWRARSPSQGDEHRLGAQAAALAKPYALMIYARQREMPADALETEARAAYQAWQAAHARP